MSNTENSDVLTRPAKAPSLHHLPQLMLSFFSVLILIFSPLISFHLVLIILAFLGRNFAIITRRFLGFILILSGSVTIASRSVAPYVSDDMFGYFWAFQRIAFHDIGIFQFYGAEFFLPMIYKILGIINPSISSSGLMFCTSAIISSIFWIWLEKFGVQYFQCKYRSLLVASSFFFFSFYFTSQLPRQMLGMSLLLFALSYTSESKRVLFLVLAFFSHHTSLIFYFLYRCLLKKTKITLGFVIFISILINLLFPIVIGIYNSGDISWIPGISKLNYYSNLSAGLTDADLAFLPHLSLILFVFLALKGPLFFKNSWGGFFLGNLVIYVCFLNIPLLSLRLCLLLVSMLLGFLFLTGTKKFANLYSICLIIFSARRIFLGFDENPQNNLWNTFPAANLEPLYYLFEIFK